MWMATGRPRCSASAISASNAAMLPRSGPRRLTPRCTTPLEGARRPEPLAPDPVDVGEVERLVDGEPVAVAVGVARPSRPSRWAGSSASAWSGVRVLCDQSWTVVMPAFSASTSPSRTLAVEVVGLVVGGGRPLGREVLEALGDEVAPERAPHVEVGLDEPGHHDHALASMTSASRAPRRRPGRDRRRDRPSRTSTSASLRVPIAGST